MAFRRLQCPIRLRIMEASEPKRPTCNLADRPKDGWPLERAAVWIDHFQPLIDAKIRGAETRNGPEGEHSTLARVSKRLESILASFVSSIAAWSRERTSDLSCPTFGTPEPRNVRTAILWSLLYRDDYYNVDGKFPAPSSSSSAKQREGQHGNSALQVRQNPRPSHQRHRNLKEKSAWRIQPRHQPLNWTISRSTSSSSPSQSPKI